MYKVQLCSLSIVFFIHGILAGIKNPPTNIWVLRLLLTLILVIIIYFRTEVWIWAYFDIIFILGYFLSSKKLNSYYTPTVNFRR